MSQKEAIVDPTSEDERYIEYLKTKIANNENLYRKRMEDIEDGTVNPEDRDDTSTISDQSKNI